MLLATGLGIGATLLATLSPAWQASRTPPLTTLSRAALEQSARRGVILWAVIGLVLLLAGLLLALFVGWKIKPEDIVTHTFPITQVSEAFELSDAGKAGKVVFVWD